jgi:transposase InsO family protein
MKAMAQEYPLRDLCAAFEVSRSGYHAWARRKPGPRAEANAQLALKIHEVYHEHDQNYGSPRVTRQLRQEGQQCTRKRVERLMREQGLRARQHKRFKVITTDSDHDQPIAPNRLKEIQIHAPNQVWAADITYVPTAEGWLYVAGVLDLFSRKLVGWAMAPHLETSLTLEALQMALEQRRPGPGLIHHSDRGVQYASADFRQRLQSYGIEASMSRKACCYDNAAMESFWSSLKNERVHRCAYQTRAEARQSIFEWIEVYYNRVRLHSSLGYKSPVDFENQLN